MTCYSRVGTYTWTQEHYESASGDARKRAHALRKLGFSVRVVPLGTQVTNVGLLKLTMIDVRHSDGNVPPMPERLERI